MEPSDNQETSEVNLEQQENNSSLDERIVKVEITSLPKAKINYAVIIALISVVISIYSLVQNYTTREETLQRMDANLKVSNKPTMVLSLDSTAIVLWNCGEGVAYDINIETHLADNIGNVGNPWVLDVLQAAMELETKDVEQLFNDANWLDQSKLLQNPPPILPKGIEYGYKTTYLLNQYAISGIFVIIRYSDGLGNKYFSIWDGHAWKFGQNNIEIVSEYKTDGSVVEQFRSHLRSFKKRGLLDSSKGLPQYYTSPYDRWLDKEAKFYKQHNLFQ